MSPRWKTIDGDRSSSAPARPVEISCDILVAGAGPGGVAASLRALQRATLVCFTEETDVSVDSSIPYRRWMNTSSSRSRARRVPYYELRKRIRDITDRSTVWLRLLPERLENFNPGACYVSSLCL